MADAAITREGDGRLAIHGELSFASVPAVWTQWQALDDGQGALAVDLSDVQRSDSAGLALLIECLRRLVDPKRKAPELSWSDASA